MYLQGQAYSSFLSIRMMRVSSLFCHFINEFSLEFSMFSIDVISISLKIDVFMKWSLRHSLFYKILSCLSDRKLQSIFQIRFVA